jgi:hypothetical protein
MKTVGGIRTGYANDLVGRAADVTLKELPTVRRWTAMRGGRHPRKLAVPVDDTVAATA